MKSKIFASLLIITVFCITSFAQAKIKRISSTSPSSKNKIEFFPLSELKEGMKGKARTVFSGSVPTPFDVEILGLVPSAIGPKQDMIVGKISGGGADRTHVFAGMSGSPVYIDGKLVGAIAYAFPFSKEAICGITPIDQMVKIFEENQKAKPAPTKPRAISFAELASTSIKSSFPKRAVLSSSLLSKVSSTSPIHGLAGQTFQPIATPVAISGISQATLNEYSSDLISVGLMPVSALGGGSKITPLKKATPNTLTGGTSVVMQLMRGDMSFAAAGTVTLRDGEKIYAFGHPFLSLGSSNLPMSESHVVTVVPNLNNSFKLAVADDLVGTMTQDRATGVFGKLGKTPKMIPVKLNMRTSRNQEKNYNFEFVRDDFLSPILLNIAVLNSIVANERSLGKMTVSVAGKINIKGHESVNVESRYTGLQASQLATASASAPVRVLLSSGFEDLEITGIEMNVTSVDESRTAVLERIGVNTAEVRAGEEFEVQAFVRSDSGRIFVQKIPVKIPKDTPIGALMVTVGDGFSLQFTSAAMKFVPKNLADLIETINKMKRNDRLYVQTHRVTKGAIIGSSEMPNLPPSVLGTLNTSRTTGSYQPTVQTILTEKEIAPAEFLISGRRSISIEVVK